MRVAVALLLLASSLGCGRLAFEPQDVDPGPDATPAASDYAAQVLADAPLAYYRLGDPAGTVASDSSGNGRHALYEQFDGGSLTMGEAGALARDADPAAHFLGEGNAGDGSSAYVWLPEEAYPLAADFTIELWVRTDGIPIKGWRACFFVWELYTVAGFRIGMNEDRQLELWSWEAGLEQNPATSIITTATIPDQTWTHVAVTYEDGVARLYLDGAQVFEGAFVFNPVEPDSPRGIGSFHGMPSDTSFDELALYDYALVPSRLQAHVAAAR